MTEITRSRVDVERVYKVSGAEPVRDSARCPIDPSGATVSFVIRNGKTRAQSIVITGKRLRGAKTVGTYSRGYYGIRPDGSVESHYRTGDPPQWVTDVVRQAITDHNAEVLT